LFFDYLPYRPFKERDRWKKYRVYPNRILNVLIMGKITTNSSLWPSYLGITGSPPTMQPSHSWSKGCYQSLGPLERKEFLVSFTILF